MKNDVHQKITAFMKNIKSKNAAEISQFFTELGDGEMKVGVERLKDYVPKLTQWKNYAIGGAAIGAVWFFSDLIKQIHQQNKESDEQAQKILTALESAMTPEEIATAESDEAPDSTDENP